MIPRKAITFSTPSEWIRAHLREDFDVCDCVPGSRVLDVGCGFGKNLEKLKARGIEARGVDPDTEGVEYCRGLGLSAELAAAESLPLPDSSVDVVILDGVIQFTVPQRALAEAHRVLRSGGQLVLVTQGPGYALNTTLARRGRVRLFGVRMLLSTPWFAMTGTRLGDTLCFSSRRMRALCEEAGFRVDLCVEGRRYFGLPVFIYLRAQKP